MHDLPKVFEQKVFHLELLNLCPWGLESLVPPFQPRMGLGVGRVNSSALCQATVMISGPRETTPARRCTDLPESRTPTCSVKPQNALARAPPERHPGARILQTQTSKNKRANKSPKAKNTSKLTKTNSSLSFPEAAFKKREDI